MVDHDVILREEANNLTIENGLYANNASHETIFLLKSLIGVF